MTQQKPTCYQSIQKKKKEITNLPLLFSQPLQDLECWQLPCWKVVLFYQSTVQFSVVTTHSRQFYQHHNCPTRPTHFWVFMSTHCLCSWLQYHKKVFFLSVCSSIFHNKMLGCWGQFALFQYPLPEEGDHRANLESTLTATALIFFPSTLNWHCSFSHLLFFLIHLISAVPSKA